MYEKNFVTIQNLFPVLTTWPIFQKIKHRFILQLIFREEEDDVVEM